MGGSKGSETTWEIGGEGGMAAIMDKTKKVGNRGQRGVWTTMLMVVGNLNC